jgi:hypothetical protein
MTEEQIRDLLEELCSELGFCLASDREQELALHPPADPKAFTRAVFVAESMNPDLVERRLFTQVHAVVQSAFDRAWISGEALRRN